MPNRGADPTARRDEGASLVEILVATLLLSLIMSITVAAFIRTNRSVQRTEDEADGLADIRVVTERLGRDVLAARSVDPSSSASSLTLWIDLDSDYIQSDAETITWAIEQNDDDSDDHFDVVRSDGTGAETVQGRTLVNDIAFTYDTGDPSSLTKTVSVSMTYDAERGGGAGERTVNFIARLRNVE